MIKTRSSRASTLAGSVQRQILLPALLLASSSVLLLSGCSSALNLGKEAAPTGTVVEAGDAGILHGGQGPVVGASINYYAIGATSSTAGNYFAALGSPLVSTTTDSNGNWSIPSYSCTPGDELYVVASGGEQKGNSTANTALEMTTLVGPCGNQFPHSKVWIDEVTTVATEYALSGFASDAMHIGTKATNLTGLINAAANVPNLVNISTGVALTNTSGYANPPANTNADTFSSIVPFDTINTLANILANCINAAGGAGDPACTSLASIAGGSSALPVGNNDVRGPANATDTADWALYVAHNPGLPSSGGIGQTNNVGPLFNLQTPTQQFAPSLSAAPNDWTLAVNYTGGGLGGATSACTAQTLKLAIDGLGNVWTVNPRTHTLSELNPQGTPISPSSTFTGGVCTTGGFGGSNLSSPKAIAIDLSNNAWVADSNNCLVGFSPSGSAMAGSPFTAPCPSAGADGVQADTSGNLWVTGLTYVTSSTPAGVQRFTPFTTSIVANNGILYQDYASNMWWVDSGANAINALALSTGSETFASGSSFLSGNTNPGYAAVGTLAASRAPSGNNGFAMFVDTPGNSDMQVPLLTGPPSPPPSLPSGGPLVPSAPAAAGLQAIANDGGEIFYFDIGTGTVGNNFVEAYDNSFTQVSPGPGAYTGGTQQSFLLNSKGVAIDQSGNLWVVNQTNYNAANKTGPYGSGYNNNGVNEANLTEFIGLANPVNPVAVANAQNQTYGTKP